MYDNDYLEKILGEQYNMSNYFEDTYTQPVVNIIDTSVEGDGTVQVSAKPKQEQATNVSTEPVQDVATNTASKRENSAIDVSTNPAPKSDSSELEVSAEPVREVATEPATESEIKVSAQPIDSSNTQVEDERYINVSNMYPEIYNAIEPIVELVVRNNMEKDMSDDLIENMTNKIYYAVEADSEPRTVQVNTSPVNNNDVIAVSTRPRNHMLHDLIKILILNNLLNRRPQRPNMPPQHHNNGNQNNRPPMPPRPRSMNVSNNISYHDVPYPEDQ